MTNQPDSSPRDVASPPHAPVAPLAESAEPGVSEATRRLLEELHTHQAELEAQNEQLRRAQLALEATQAKYVDLYDRAPAGYLSLSEPGLIVEANDTANALLGARRHEPVSYTHLTLPTKRGPRGQPTVVSDPGF